MNSKIYFLIAIVVIIVIVTSIGFYQYNRPHKKIEDRDIDVTTNPENFISDIEKNIDNANQTYANKVIFLSGKIYKIEKPEEENGDCHLIFNSDNSELLIDCTLRNDQTYNNLVPGNEILIKGVFKGTLFDIILDHCIIINKENRK